MNSNSLDFMSFLATRIVPILILFFSSSTIIAQEGGIKIGVVDVSRLLSQSPQYISVMETLQQEFSPREREIIAIHGNLMAIHCQKIFIRRSQLF